MLPALVVLACLVVAALGRAGDAAVLRARADAVADLTALAAVSGDGERAEQVARIGGASSVELDGRDGSVVEVTVELRGVQARAAAAPEGDPAGQGAGRAEGAGAPRR